MEIVILRVGVEKQSLDALERQVTALQNRKIVLSVDTSGLEKLSNAQAKVIASANNLAAAEAKAQQAQAQASAAASKLSSTQEKTAQAGIALAAAEQKTAQAGIALAASQEKVHNANQKATSGMTTLGTSAEKTGDNFSRALGKMLLWTAAGSMIYAPIRAFQDALETMKAVDKELIEVSKVTTRSADDLKRLGAESYSVASKYGAAAEDLLRSVADFARAGYDEQSEALAELSAKTQIAGNVSRDVANNFLITVDAAYGYKGSVEELSKVLDGAAKIDNNYATSIGEIAAGLGKIAPLAAQTHVSVGELTAAIGTISATTRRSGSEVATALRALFLNILGDTKTEIDEGVTWTTGEIAGLKDVLKEYASEAVAAAKATGQVINPMEAIAGLAQSMKDGVLTEEKLVQMTNDIGGKLRTTQLIALIQHWDMYKAMLSDFGGAYGTVDTMVAKSLDSWDAKTKILSNTWNEFVSKTIDTGWIKGLVDDVTWLIKGFGDLGTAVFTFGGMLIAIKLPTILNWFQQIGLQLSLLKLEFRAGADGAGGFANGMRVLAGSATAAQVAIAGLTAAITIAIMVYNNWHQAQVEAWQAAEKAGEKAKTEADAIYDLYSKYLALKDGVNAGTASQKDFQAAADAVVTKLAAQNTEVADLAGNYDKMTEAVRKATIEQLKSRLPYAQAATAAAEQGVKDKFAGSFIDKAGAGSFAQNFGKTYGFNTATVEGQIATYKKLIEARNRLIESGTKEGLSYDYISQAIAQLEPAVEEYNKAAKNEADIQTQIRNVMDGTAKATPAAADATKKAADTVKELQDRIKSLNDEINSAQSSIKAITAAQKEYNDTGKLSVDTEQALLSMSPEYLAVLVDQNGQININSDAVNNLIGNKTVLLKTLAAEQVATYALTSLQELMAEATNNAGTSASNSTKGIQDATTAMMNMASKGMAAAAGVGMLGQALDQLAGANNAEAKGIDLESWKINVETYAQNLTAIINAAGSGIESFTGGGEGGGGGEEKDPWAKARESLDKYLAEQERAIDLQERQGAGTDQVIAAYKAMQDRIHAMAVKYREETGIEDDDFTRQLSLLWFKYADKIKDVIQDVRDDAVDKIKDALDQVKQLEDAITDSIDTQNDAREDAKNLAEKQAAIQEKQLELSKAQIALENAKKERTIRMWNAATGQWEHTYDYKTVQSAQDNLTKAQKDLTKAQDDLSEYLTTQSTKNLKNSTQKAYTAFEDAVKTLEEALKKGSISITDFYTSLAIQAKEISDKYGVDMTTAFGMVVANIKDGAIQMANAFAQIPGLGTMPITVLDGKTQTPNLPVGTAISGGNGITYIVTGGQSTSVGGNGYTSVTGTTVNATAAGGFVSVDTSGHTVTPGLQAGTVIYSADGAHAWQVTGGESIYAGGSGYTSQQLYDSGGVLEGKGGIKATNRPETVIGPDLTEKMLAPNSNEMFRQRVAELGYLFGNNNTIPGMERPVTTNNSSINNSKSYYGGQVYVGGIEVSDQTAAQVLARLARANSVLSLYPV